MNKKMTLLALLASFALAGCGGSPDSSHATGLSTPEEGTSHATGLSTPEEGTSHATGLSTPEAQPSSQEQVSYTAEKVAADTNANIVKAGNPGLQLEYDSEYNEWYSSAEFGPGTDESEDALKEWANTYAYFLPDYMKGIVAATYGDPTKPDYVDIYEDGSIYYVIQCLSPDKAVCAQAISYVWEGQYCAEFSIYDLWAA